jgi:hypothetical protein
VLAELPRAGLGNMLLVWGRAFVLAHRLDLPLLVSSWSKLRIGPWLRVERHKRLYVGTFRRQNATDVVRRALVRRLFQVIREPDPLTTNEIPAGNVAVFDTVPSWQDYFYGLREHRDAVRAALLAMTSTQTRQRVDRFSSPTVSVHVRCGDFKKLAAGTDFAKVGSTRTPLDYFVESIHDVRARMGAQAPVPLFSDGTDEELGPLLTLPNVSRIATGDDLADILLMARSQVVVPSAGSTFGYWAGFLSDGVVVVHPEHTHARLRPEGPAFLERVGPVTSHSRERAA